HSIRIHQSASLPSSHFSYYSRPHRPLHSFPTRRSSDLASLSIRYLPVIIERMLFQTPERTTKRTWTMTKRTISVHVLLVVLSGRSEEHTSELQSRFDLVCRLLLEKKKKNILPLLMTQ